MTLDNLIRQTIRQDRFPGYTHFTFTTILEKPKPTGRRTNHAVPQVWVIA